MRILTVSEVYPSADKPQYGVFIKQQMDELKHLGYKVDILMPIRSAHNSNISETCFEDTRVYSVGYRVIRYELFLKRAAHSVYHQLKQLIQDNRYTLLAVHITGDTILKIITDIGKELGIPVVVHYHGLNVWKEYVNKHRIRELFYACRRASILKKVQAIVGVSDKVCGIVRERIHHIPVRTVYNGVETQLFYPQMDKENVFTIVGVGNLIPIKGFRFLIEAFAHLYETDKNIRLKILGEGVERGELEALAKAKGASEAITFLGKVPYEQVASEMRCSHLFVLPSYYEALGCVYLEAMACGIPTIGVKGMGIDEIIVDGENGLLVVPQDITSLCERMQSVIRGEQFAEKLGENGRIRALQYTWKASAETLDKVYKEVRVKK